MIKFVADSGCDIQSMEGVHFSVAPLSIHTDHNGYLDDDTLNIPEMIDELLAYKGRSFTSCPSVDAWMKVYEPEAGYENDEIQEVYVVTLTSTLSGTWNSANTAKNLYLQDHPDTKILIVDSLSVGGEEKLLVEKLIEMKQQGMSFEEIETAIEEYKAHTHLFFAFQSLHNLVQNGRVKKLSAVAAGALHITVYGKASDAGEVEMTGKARGDKRVVSSMLSEMQNYGYRGGKVRIGHIQNESMATMMMAAIKRQYTNADVTIYPCRGLCSYYGERGGIILGYEG